MLVHVHFYRSNIGGITVIIYFTIIESSLELKYRSVYKMHVHSFTEFSSNFSIVLEKNLLL